VKAIAYVRVSTDRQAEQGLGLEVQRRAIKTWAKTNGHRIVATHRDEGVSGSKGLDTRPGLASAFQALEDGQADALVVYRLDRLARKLASQETWIETLERKGRKVVSVTEPEYGEDETRDFVRQVLGAVAQYERAVIVRRMQSGRAEKAARGGYAYGSPAFGQRVQDGELIPDEAESAVVARIRELGAQGASLRQIAERLDAEGSKPKRGDRWHAQTVRRVLARPEPRGDQDQAQVQVRESV
jgi:DNA invertase Pin-like site-specific DNA recombinase